MRSTLSSRLRARWFAALGASLLALSATAADPDAGQPWLARVSYVVDGDSIWVRPDGGGARVKLRLEGIDAPEICQRYGPEARTALQALVLGQHVRVTVQARDRYGRAIARVTRLDDQLDVAQSMVLQGWAWNETYRWHRGHYGPQEAAARDAGRGLFAEPRPEAPQDFRRRHGSCYRAR